MSTAGDDSPSVDGNGPNRTSLNNAPKNKQCPFCHESFTSSSLGRHLDLYIKDKNPKASDGIHHADKIRQIRGAITRRQPRRNTKAFDEANTPVTTGSRTGTPHTNVASPYTYHANDRRSKWVFNKPTWEATGVMIDLPPTPTLGVDHDARKHLSKNDSALRKRMAEERTRQRATELALQELLDSVNAAKTQAYPSTPYAFDFLGQTFPGLCLRLLPQQPSLQSLQVIENPKYCPIGPPKQTHYELLMRSVKARLDEFAVILAQTTESRFSLKSAMSSSSIAQQEVPDTFDPSTYTAHLTQAWEVWKAIPESQKVTQWHLEVFRALGDSQDEQKRLSDTLGKAEAESQHLRIQIDRLNECQQPKEFTYQIPTNWHISKETASVAVSQQIDAPPDRETLINKWTTIVQGNSKFQRALPEIGLIDVSTDPDSMYMDSHRVNGDQHNEGEDDGDDADATGEEDDDIEGAKQGFTSQKNRNMDTSFMDQNMLDPGLREDGDMDVDGGDYGAEMLLTSRAQRGKAYEM